MPLCGSDVEFEMDLQRLLKEHQQELMARIREKLTVATDDLVDRVLALCLEMDHDLDTSPVGDIADGSNSMGAANLPGLTLAQGRCTADADGGKREARA